MWAQASAFHESSSRRTSYPWTGCRMRTTPSTISRVVLAEDMRGV